MLRCRVLLLDDTYIERELEKNAVGQVLFDNVCEYLNLLERDYFGLASWESSNTKVWLDVSKEVRKQVLSQQATFTFNVKFYPPDPSLLAEDITRYLLCLQLRLDIMTGRLSCPSDTLAVLGSYTIQSEFGDYDPDLHGHDFLSNIPLAPDQTPELEEKVKELHCTHKSMSPAQADKLFLQTARTLPLYGVHLHPAKDAYGTDVMLGVCADGLLVYEDGENTQSMAWPRVLKMSYKRNNFHGRIRRMQDSSESTINYGLPNYRACKCLWKNAVEHHAFFRNHRQDKAAEGLLHFGSRFRLRGLTYDEALESGAVIKREALHFSHSAIKRKAKDSMLVALKRPNRTEVDDWFQILASDQWPTYPETLDVELDALAKAETDSRPYPHKEMMKENELDKENTWFELLGGRSSPFQLTSVSDTLDRAVLNSWKQSDDDWFVLLEPRTLHSRFLPVETPLSGEVIEWEEVTSEESVKVIKIRKEVHTVRKGHEELEVEQELDIVGELDTETKQQIMQIIEEKLEEKGNGDQLQKVVVFQQRTLEEDKYTGRPQEVSTEQRIRRVEIVKKMHETVSEGSEVISEGTIEELQKRLLEVEAIEQNLQDIEMLNLGLQELQAWQRQLELQGRQRGEMDDWYLLLDRKPVAVSSAPGALEQIESQTPEQLMVEEVKMMEQKRKWEEEETRQVKESTQFKTREQSRKEVDDGWFALLDVSSKGTVPVPSRIVHDQEVTREETGPVLEKVTSVKTLIYEETEERRGGMVETASKVVHKNPVVQRETDDWFVLLEPISYETRIIPSVPLVEVYEYTVTVQEKEESIDEKPVIIKEVQTKARAAGEVEMKIPVGTREVDDTWVMHFDPTPFEKRSIATDWLVPVPLTELYEETVGLRTQQRLTVKEKELTTEEKRVIVREVQMKTGEVEKKNPVVRREADDSWFVLFDQTPVEKRRVATGPPAEVYEDTVGLQRVTIKRKEIITDEGHVILTEKRAIAGEAEKKMAVSRREVDDSWAALFDPTPFEKGRVATELLQEDRAAWRKGKVEDKQIIRVKESAGLSDTLISEETRLKEVHERRLREEDRRRKCEVELRRPPPRLPLLRAVEHRREVEDDWHVLLEVQPKKSELLQEDRVAWRKRKVEDKQIIRVKESVPVVSPVDVPKARPQPPVDQPMTSTPTAQPVRITSPSYQDDSLTRLTITQDVTQDISQESKTETESVVLRKTRARKIKGETIYIRHSILMLEDFDVTQEVVLRHHASISELKRLFMEDIPICVPTEWEKRLSTHTPVIIPQLTNGDLVLA